MLLCLFYPIFFNFTILRFLTRIKSRENENNCCGKQRDFLNTLCGVDLFVVDLLDVLYYFRNILRVAWCL